MKTFPICVLVVLALSPQRSGAQNLLTNGSFELIAYPTNHGATLFPGATSLPGWVLQGTGSAYIVTTPLTGWSFMALDGKQFFDFNDSTLTLSQSFPTEPGGTYEIAFSGGHFQGPNNMQIIAQVLSTDGTVLGALTATVPGPSQWMPFRFRFTARTPTSTLQFHSSNATGNTDLAMDAVSVQFIARGVMIDVSQVRLCWPSQTNRMYQIQYSTNLAANAWANLGAPIPGSGGTDCSLQSVIDPQRFYRVVVVP